MAAAGSIAARTGSRRAGTSALPAARAGVGLTAVSVSDPVTLATGPFVSSRIAVSPPIILASAGERASRDEQLRGLVRSGRLPISQRNVEGIAPENGADRHEIIEEWSRDADLALVGMRREKPAAE